MLDRARARPSVRLAIRLAVLALALAGLGALGVAGAGEDTTERVRAAGAGIQAAEVPTTAVHRDAVQRAADRPTVGVAAHREGEVHAGTAEVKRRRYAVPEPAAGTTVWDRLAGCESGGDWATSAGPHEGGLQFHPDTWDRHRPAGYPDGAHHASREQQIHVAERVLADQGWSAWPGCARQLGLR